MQRRRPPRVTHRPPNAASVRGMLQAMAAVYGRLPPMTDAERAKHEHDAAQVPYRKPQRELALGLPDPE